MLMSKFLGADGRHSEGFSQFSGQRICFAEWTRQGSAWFGELRIFREYSFDDAMTMKLHRRTTNIAGPREQRHPASRFDVVVREFKMESAQWTRRRQLQDVNGQTVAITGMVCPAQRETSHIENTDC